MLTPSFSLLGIRLGLGVTSRGIRYANRKLHGPLSRCKLKRKHPVQMQMSKEGQMRLVQVLQPFVSLASSVLLGVSFGVALSTFVGWRASLWMPLTPVARRLPISVSHRSVYSLSFCQTVKIRAAFHLSLLCILGYDICSLRPMRLLIAL